MQLLAYSVINYFIHFALLILFKLSPVRHCFSVMTNQLKSVEVYRLIYGHMQNRYLWELICQSYSEMYSIVYKYSK